eukprot:11752492-Alexandrium_andersonii.AAC.1
MDLEVDREGLPTNPNQNPLRVLTQCNGTGFNRTMAVAQMCNTGRCAFNAQRVRTPLRCCELHLEPNAIGRWLCKSVHDPCTRCVLMAAMQ